MLKEMNIEKWQSENQEGEKENFYMQKRKKGKIKQNFTFFTTDMYIYKILNWFIFFIIIHKYINNIIINQLFCKYFIIIYMHN